MSDGSYHPSRAPLSITLLKGSGGASGGSLVCEYFPESASEALAAEFKDIPAGGAAMKTLQFMWGEPRKISMRLFFNDWGNNPDRKVDGRQSVAASLSWLRSVFLPWNGKELNTNQWKAGGAAIVGGGAMPPPLLAVALTDEVFEGHLTSMTINYTKLSPSKTPIRAEVDVEFTQYVPVNAGGQK